jgi:hypothetical protein
MSLKALIIRGIKNVRKCTVLDRIVTILYIRTIDT